MLKKKPKSLLVAVLMLCIVINSFPSFAADNRVGKVVDGSLLTEGSEVSYIEASRAKGNFLNFGIGGLTNLGGHQLYMSGNTTCHQTCNKVSVTLTLQRLEGSSWVNYAYMGTVSAYNTYEVSAGDTFSVSGGYYYRVYGSHVAVKGNSSEACYSWSDGLWVP